MSTSGISFGGLASGLDTQAIISALLAVERRPIDALESKKIGFNRSKSLFNSLEEKLKGLQEAADAIKLAPNFLDFSAATDVEDYLTASAGTGAISGTFDIAIQQLAAAETKASLGRASKDTPDFTGTIFFDMPDGSSFSTTVNAASLDGVASAINGITDLEVRAQVIDTGTPSDPFQLILTSTAPGADGSFTVSGDLGPSELVNLLNETEANTITAGSDAQLTYNGVTVFRSTNTISDLVPGVTLELKGISGATPTKVTVTPDAEATSEKIQELVDKYNEVLDFFAAQSTVDEEGQSDSPLFGDSTVRSIRSGLRSALGRLVPANDPSFQLLSQVGIESDRDGRLTFNKTDFEEALSTDELQVRDLFSNQTDGLAKVLSEQIDVYTDFVDGLIKVRTDGIERSVKDLNRQIERAEDRLEKKEIQLTDRFSKMEILLSRLQSQGSALSGLPPIPR